jgi:hypothetical protein
MNAAQENFSNIGWFSYWRHESSSGRIDGNSGSIVASSGSLALLPHLLVLLS